MSTHPVLGAASLLGLFWGLLSVFSFLQGRGRGPLVCLGLFYFLFLSLVLGSPPRLSPGGGGTRSLSGSLRGVAASVLAAVATPSAPPLRTVASLLSRPSPVVDFPSQPCPYWRCKKGKRESFLNTFRLHPHFPPTGRVTFRFIYFYSSFPFYIVLLTSFPTLLLSLYTHFSTLGVSSSPSWSSLPPGPGPPEFVLGGRVLGALLLDAFGASQLL